MGAAGPIKGILPGKIKEEYLDELNKSIVTIQKKNENVAIGFFIKININKLDNSFLLISNYIKPFKINKDSEIDIVYNNIKTNINMKNRYIKNCTNPRKITFIEIFDNDILDGKNKYTFLSPDKLYKSGYNKYNNKSIYSIGEPNNLYRIKERNDFSKGEIKEIIDKEFNFTLLDEKLIFPGMPICLFDNKLLLGVQKNKKEWGYFIGYYIDEIEKKYKEYKEYKIKEITMNNKVIINEEKKINKSNDEIFINKKGIVSAEKEDNKTNKEIKTLIDYLDFIIKKNCTPYKDYYEFFKFLYSNNNSIFFVKASIFDKIKYNKFKEEFLEKLEKKKFSELEKSCIGSILGMAIGDAIGSRVEFLPLNYNNKKIQDMGKTPGGYFKLEPGQWTDDSSMGLCIADSLIEKKGEFDPRDIMMRFILWWKCGYINAFRLDDKRNNKHSVGLGGNIKDSLYKYIQEEGKNPYTQAGDKNTSGNGSIMRNAAIPICYFRNEQSYLEFSKKQSLITHQGEEAAGCCQLLSFIIVKILKEKGLKREMEINLQSNNEVENLKKENNKEEKKEEEDERDLEEINLETINQNEKNLKDILENLQDFKCECQSVNYLAYSKQEGDDKNRNWNWKNKNFKYSEYRAKKQPGYIGSYCMDGFSMALHVLYTTSTFKEAILKGVNLCGDADSVGSVIGQIAGAFYGLDSIPKDWIKTINKWDHKEIALRGYILCHLNEIKKI